MDTAQCFSILDTRNYKLGALVIADCGIKGFKI
jgi:hypothetical protein